MISDTRLGEIRALLAGITPGPWVAPGDMGDVDTQDRSYTVCVLAVDADAAFIAAAPAIVDELLAEVEKLQAVVEAAKAVREYGDGMGFGGYSPNECVFCRTYLFDIEDGSDEHEADCEFRVLRDALANVSGEEGG